MCRKLSINSGRVVLMVSSDRSTVWPFMAFAAFRAPALFALRTFHNFIITYIIIHKFM